MAPFAICSTFRLGLHRAFPILALVIIAIVVERCDNIVYRRRACHGMAPRGPTVRGIRPATYQAIALVPAGDGIFGQIVPPTNQITSSSDGDLDADVAVSSPSFLAQLLATVMRCVAVAFDWDHVVYIVLANVGQAYYASANANLDAHARALRAHGAATCSLQWPLEGGAGMGAEALAEVGERQVAIAVWAGN